MFFDDGFFISSKNATGKDCKHVRWMNSNCFGGVSRLNAWWVASSPNCKKEFRLSSSLPNDSRFVWLLFTMAKMGFFIDRHCGIIYEFAFCSPSLVYSVVVANPDSLSDLKRGSLRQTRLFPRSKRDKFHRTVGGRVGMIIWSRAKIEVLLVHEFMRV